MRIKTWISFIIGLILVSAFVTSWSISELGDLDLRGMMKNDTDFGGKDIYNFTNANGSDIYLTGNITASWGDINVSSGNVKSPYSAPALGYALSHFVDNYSNAIVDFFNIDYNRWIGDFDGMQKNLDNVSNISIVGYYDGQPVDGGFGSGIISADDVNIRGGLNITDEGVLNVSYGAFVVRLQYNNNNSVKYCSMTADEITVTDDQHSAYYIDWNCALQSVTIATRTATDLSPGGTVDVFDVYATDGDIEDKHGKTVMSAENCKTRRKILETDHLQVISGMAKTTGTFSVFETSSGSYLYFRTVKDTSAQNTTEDGIHYVSHVGGSWTHDNQSDLNLTHCDDGTDAVTCATNTYRQYLIYMLGSTNGGDTTKLHQLAPLTTDTTYAAISACIDATPSYTLPAKEEYVAVPLYIYCGKRDDAAWRDGWIDLRDGTGAVGAQPDLTPYLRRDGTTALTDNWDVGEYNVTASGFHLGTDEKFYFGDSDESYMYENGSALIIGRN